MGSGPFHSPALQSGPCHCCPGACKDLLPLPGVLVTGVQMAPAPTEVSLVTWLLAPVGSSQEGVGWAKWALTWKQAVVSCPLPAFQNHSLEPSLTSWDSSRDCFHGNQAGHPHHAPGEVLPEPLLK